MGDDLIDRKALMEAMREIRFVNMQDLKAWIEAELLIERAPAAFDKEKVIEELTIRKRIEDEKAAAFDEAGDIQNMEVRDSISLAFQKAIEIVAKGGI